MNVDLSILATRAQEGDEKSLSLLLQKLEPIFRGFFVKRIGSRIVIDYLIQNTLIRVHKGLSDLKDPARVKGFAMKAALFERQDFYRGRYTAKESLFDAFSRSEGHATLTNVGAVIDVERALQRLSPRARKIIELREYGYRYEEIAEIIGSTEAAIKMQVKRAFDTLREILAALLLWFS